MTYLSLFLGALAGYLLAVVLPYWPLWLVVLIALLVWRGRVRS